MDYKNCTIVYVDEKRQAQVVKIVDGEMSDPFRQLFANSIRLLKKMQRTQNAIDSGELDGDGLDVYTDTMRMYIDEFKKCRELIDEGLQLRRDFMEMYNEDDNGWYEYFGCFNAVADMCREICRNVDIHDREFRRWTEPASEYIMKSFNEEGLSFDEMFDQWKNRIMRIKCSTLRTGLCLALKKCMGDMLNSVRRQIFDGFITGDYLCGDDCCDELYS